MLELPAPPLGQREQRGSTGDGAAQEQGLLSTEPGHSSPNGASSSDALGCLHSAGSGGLLADAVSAEEACSSDSEDDGGQQPSQHRGYHSSFDSSEGSDCAEGVAALEQGRVEPMHQDEAAVRRLPCLNMAHRPLSLCSCLLHKVSATSVCLYRGLPAVSCCRTIWRCCLAAMLWSGRLPGARQHWRRLGVKSAGHELRPAGLERACTGGRLCLQRASLAAAALPPCRAGGSVVAMYAGGLCRRPLAPTASSWSSRCRQCLSSSPRPRCCG